MKYSSIYKYYISIFSNFLNEQCQHKYKRNTCPDCELIDDMNCIRWNFFQTSEELGHSYGNIYSISCAKLSVKLDLDFDNILLQFIWRPQFSHLPLPRCTMVQMGGHVNFAIQVCGIWRLKISIVLLNLVKKVYADTANVG